MASFSRRTFLCLIICLHIFCYSLFLIGFFPLKKSLPGFATIQNYSLDKHEITQPGQQFDKVVIILIDALRTDFIFEQERMPFINQLLNEGVANGYTVRAHPPTVTLPRIKALTSGTIPGFVDVVLNFDSKSLTEDNIISQAHRLGKKTVFFGDDTWIKLFPDHFIRSDGTTSFFVTDFTEVDDNVTRHLDTELSNTDWDLMILHYLGLDHIGHTHGPKSSLVTPKLKEMDDIIQKIYEQISEKESNFLLLVCGDHGMSDQGSHGGASDREVLVPAVFLSPRFKQSGKRRESRRDVLQIDLAPTLSVLMGTPIPRNNLGQILVDTLYGMSEENKLSCMYINSNQILQLMMENVPDYQKDSSMQLYEHAKRLHLNFLNHRDQSTADVRTILQTYETVMEAMSSKIARSLTTYDLYSMCVAIVMLCLCLVTLFVVIMAGLRNVEVRLPYHVLVAVILLVSFSHMTICTSQSCDSVTLCGWSLTSVLCQSFILFGFLICLGTISNNLQILKLRQGWLPAATLPRLLLFGTLLHTLSFGSSSFVEEEHQTWYFMCMTFYLVTLVTQVKGHIHKSLTAEMSWNSLYDQSSTFNGGKSINEQIYSNQDVQNNSSYKQCNGVNKQLNKDGFRGIIYRLPWKQICGILGTMLLFRCMRTLNQTGNKWLDTPDIGDWLIRSENKTVLTYTVVLSYFVTVFVKTGSVCLQDILFIIGIIVCYGYRVTTSAISHVVPVISSIEQSSQGIVEARCVYCIILLIVISALIKYIWLTNDRHTQLLELVESLQTVWILVMFLLLRTHNTILVAMTIVQEKLVFVHIIKKTSLPSSFLALMCWWIGQAAFFQQGNSNSMSSVDVSAGYVGLLDYQPVIVCTLLFCSTYAGPIYWMISMVKFVLHTQQHKWKSKKCDETTRDTTFISMEFIECIQTLTLERMCTLLFYCVVVTSQRYHLFVWTVFSPKLLYEAMLTLTVCLFSGFTLSAIN